MSSMGPATHEPPVPSPARDSSAIGTMADLPPLVAPVSIGVVGGITSQDSLIALTDHKGSVDSLLLHNNSVSETPRHKSSSKDL